MKRLLIICLCLFIAACTQKKEPLAPTQIVNGRSIVMPPEFFVLPKMPSSTIQQSSTVES